MRQSLEFLGGVPGDSRSITFRSIKAKHLGRIEKSSFVGIRMSIGASYVRTFPRPGLSKLAALEAGIGQRSIVLGMPRTLLKGTSLSAATRARNPVEVMLPSASFGATCVNKPLSDEWTTDSEVAYIAFPAIRIAAIHAVLLMARMSSGM